MALFEEGSDPSYYAILNVPKDASYEVRFDQGLLASLTLLQCCATADKHACCAVCWVAGHQALLQEPGTGLSPRQAP
jgi:hypothetical protein